MPGVHQARRASGALDAHKIVRNGLKVNRASSRQTGGIPRPVRRPAVIARAVVGPGNDLHEHVDDGRRGNGDQHSDKAPEVGRHNQGEHYPDRVQPHPPPHHTWGQEVPLKPLNHDINQDHLPQLEKRADVEQRDPARHDQ